MANQFYTYKIVFEDGGGGENNETPVKPNTGEEINTKNPTSQKRDSAVKTAVMTTALQQIGKNAFNIVSSNIGQWTGDSGLQDGINLAMRVGGYAMAFATNWVVGAITVITDATTQAITESNKNMWLNKEAQSKARYLGVINKRSR